MDQLRKGIGLRGYAQQDPIIAYKQEGHEMFEEMIERIQTVTVSRLLKGRIIKVPAMPQRAPQRPVPPVRQVRPQAQAAQAAGAQAATAPRPQAQAAGAQTANAPRPQAAQPLRPYQPKPVDDKGNFVPEGTQIHRPKDNK